MRTVNMTVTMLPLFAALLMAAVCVQADVVLIGSDIPNKSVLDGDFEDVRPAPWRSALQSPYWTTKILKGGGKVGVADGRMMNNGASVATVESPVLDHTELKTLFADDVLAWRFASNTEYPCDGRVSLGLVFGDQERVVASRVKVPNGPEGPQVYEGFYTVSADDMGLGMPKAKFTLETTHGIKVYIDWVDLKVLQGERVTELGVNAIDGGIELTWNGDCDQAVTIFRSDEARKGFMKLDGGVRGNRWVDNTIINGKVFYYAVKLGPSVSPVVAARIIDSVAPAAPHSVNAVGRDWDVKLQWQTDDNDVAYYRVYRGDADGKNMACIAPHVGRDHFEDMLPVKGVENAYAVEAVDLSGNTGPRSAIATARVKTVRGASFSDLILPMPISRQLRSDVWGADGVRPRDPDNGVEDPFCSYWGGKVIKDPSDGKYHICVTRWPEGDRKGHWAWPYSTVAHVVSDKPTGPYVVKDATAYEYSKGLGHNPNIIVLNDGTYALYSLINWKAMILASVTMNGPWKVLGEMKVNVPEDYKNAYRLERNLSGVQCRDGSFLFVTKAGAMMRSTTGVLGPYEVVSGTVGENRTIPEPYRKSNYEDPTMWYDGVQYHMLINAFLDYRAIYLRSLDGINWKYEDGLAYTPTCTEYEDGTRTFWYKVERPNVLQDEYGRATHLSLAVTDVPKAEDYGNDNHSAKHLIIPLTVPKRLKTLNRHPITRPDTRQIEVLVYSEDGFDAQKELDLESLRFGASEEVNFRRGCKLSTTVRHAKGLVLVFDPKGHGLSERNFVGKLIGRTTSGGLVVGYTRLSAE